MPPELWAILTNAGPVAGIMGFMWWLERKQRVELQDKYEALLKEAPDKLIVFTEEHRRTHDRLTKAVWAAIKKLGPRRSTSTDAMPAVSIPPEEG